MVKTIREVARETSQELGQAFTESRRFLKKRIRKPTDMKFAVVPPQYYQPVQKPRPVKRRMKRRRR